MDGLMTTGQAHNAQAMSRTELAAALERRGITPPCRCGAQTFIGRGVSTNPFPADGTQLRCASCLKPCRECAC